MAKISFENEVILKGKSASPGIVVGTARLFDQKNLTFDNDEIEKGDKASEKKKIDTALNKVLTELHNAAHFARRRSNDSHAIHIIETQKEITRDPELHRQITALIEDQSFSAARAVRV